jgi:hypothetical protein
MRYYAAAGLSRDSLGVGDLRHAWIVGGLQVEPGTGVATRFRGSADTHSILIIDIRVTE